MTSLADFISRWQASGAEKVGTQDRLIIVNASSQLAAPSEVQRPLSAQTIHTTRPMAPPTIALNLNRSAQVARIQKLS